MRALRLWQRRLHAGVMAIIALLSLRLLVDATPLGPLGRMALAALQGRPYRGPSPLASYRGQDGRSYAFLLPPEARSLQAITSAARCLPGEVIAPIAGAREVRPSDLAALLDGFAEIDDKGCRVLLDPRLESRVIEALPGGVDRAALRADPRRVARGLAALLQTQRRGFADTPAPDDLALEALLVGPAQVRAAMQAARAAGLAPAWSFDVHRSMLSADAAERADQAIAVLARARLARLLWPVGQGFRVSSPFGERLHPVLRTQRFHNGVDIAVPLETALRAALDGQVRRVAADRISGNYVRVDHGLGIEAVYCHLQRAAVTAGDRVRRGQTLAYSGNSGRSTGPHLHFTLRLFGKAIDPGLYAP